MTDEYVQTVDAPWQVVDNRVVSVTDFTTIENGAGNVIDVCIDHTSALVVMKDNEPNIIDVEDLRETYTLRRARGICCLCGQGGVDSAQHVEDANSLSAVHYLPCYVGRTKTP